MVATLSLQAQSKSRFWSKFNLDSLSNRNLRFLPLPSLTISPETGVKGGVFLDYFYRTKANNSGVTRPSLSWVQALYSTRGQLTLEAYTSTYTNNEQFYIFFKGGFISNYERFWGYSNPTASNKNFTELTYDRLYASARITKNVGNKIFTGVNLYYSKHNNIDTLTVNKTPLVPSPDFTNSEVLGAGISVIQDKRNNQFSPSEGHYYDVSLSWMNNTAVSNGNYLQWNVDLRKYYHLPQGVWATQLLAQATDQNAPMLEKARIGGNALLRGYFQGRFRDNNLWALQSEYRYNLSRFFRLAFFAGVGGTGTTTATLFKNDLLLSGGTGLRLLINKDKQIYLRADVAYTVHGSFGYYFRIGDAF
jgi:hemolysin activation/secretion protein